MVESGFMPSADVPRTSADFNFSSVGTTAVRFLMFGLIYR
jgi:hypothetical protein